MKKVLEKVRKNKPRQQKMPKSRSSGRNANHEDDGDTGSSWKDRFPKHLQQLFVRKKQARYSVSSQMSPETNEPFLRGGLDN